jgi:uncharacterized RDD family membrane protein YckC
MVSEFYDRKRRLAAIIALLSVGLLLAGLYVGFLLELYSHPRAAGLAEGAAVIHQSRNSEDAEAVSKLLLLDPSLRLGRRVTLMGEARGLLPDGEEVTAVFGSRLSTIRGGGIVQSRDIPQGWQIEAAARDPLRGRSWIFGWSDKQIKARRISPDSEAVTVAPSPEIERMCASAGESGGPLVAWREENSALVKAALYDGTRFVPCAQWEIGASRYWDVAMAGRRAILVYHSRDDRNFSVLRLRLRCCPGCGESPPPDTLDFGDPVFAVGRKVTGLAVAAAGDRLLVAVTRPTTVHVASAPLDTLRADPGTRLVALGSEALWRRMAAWMIPFLMLFFSFSLVFLGFTLLKERGRFILENLVAPADDGPVHAEILQRAMAFILDLMVLIPALALLSDLFNWVPETAEVDLSDPRWRGFLGLAFGLDMAYHYVFEWASGWTVGKRILGLRVTEADGSRLTFRGALLRNLVRPVDAQFPLGVFLGMSILMVTRRRQRAGDLLARTLVVQDRKPG